MNDTSKNLAIGILVTIALGLLIWALFFLHPTFGDGGFRFHARFTDIEKISDGTRVNYAGRVVGEVIDIAFVPEKEQVHDNEVYVYDLTLAIDSNITLYTSDELSVGRTGLMGERFISITPKRPKIGFAKPIEANEVIYATKSASFDEALTKADKTLEILTDMVKENRKEVSTLITSATSVFEQLNNAVDETDALITYVGDGKGSIGKMLMSDAFYNKTQGVMNKLDILLDDINRYGVLFHLDKGWQRSNKRIIQELDGIQTSQELKSFLDEEMYKITKGVSRLEKALDKAQNFEDSDAFRKAVSELLIELQDLEATLKRSLDKEK